MPARKRPRWSMPSLRAAQYPVNTFVAPVTKGVVQDQRDVVAWSERRQYTQLAAQYGGYYAPDKGDRDQGGGVILLLPKPVPVIEATVVHAPANEDDPILILPDAPKGEVDA
jgi:hypothetical protein